MLTKIAAKLTIFKKGYVRSIILILLLGLTIRFIPYLLPIRARDIAQKQQAFKFSDRNNLPLGTILTQNQNNTSLVNLNQISPYFIQAIIAAEDQRFYQHGPIDMTAMARSILEAIQAKQIVSGGSTITMQLARMLQPSPRTLPYKLQEIWLAWRLDAGMNKSEILQNYINRLPMGSNIYGIDAASRIYFGISAQELNLAQATILAALPNDPTDLNPYLNWAKLKRRQAYVLKRMVADKYITNYQANQALSEKIYLQQRQQGIIAAPHFLFWLSNQLSQKLKINSPVPFQVKTTIDRPLQQFVEAQVQQIVKDLADYNVHQAAALVIDNHTGEILAYVGSTDYFNELNQGRNDGVQALRQPGSTLKPFLYELGLEKGIIKPNTILADVPTYYAIPGAKLYNPTNYNEETFLGPVRVRIALANSLNIPAVRVLEKVGVPDFLTRLKDIGFSHLNKPAEHYGLGLTLGSGEVSLWELTQSYLLMANNGKIKPVITDFLPHSVTNSSRSLPEETATWQLITNILSDRHARAQSFGVDSVLSLPFPAAVKTGTSSNFRDTWTVGFTKDYTVGTWVGNFNGDRLQKVSGVMGAAPLWSRIMLHLHEDQEPGNFPQPQKLVSLPICADSGWQPQPDCQVVVREYFYPEDVAEYRHQAKLISANNSPNLSADYNEWLARQNNANLPGKKLRILLPKNDDYFLLDNTQNSARLEFKLGGMTSKPVELWLNGMKIATTKSPSFFWVMQPGKWNLEVRQGNQVDRASFTVQIDAPLGKKRGFSIKNSP